MSAKDLLDTIRVESPCEVSWDSMIGNDQVRFCEHCNLTVNDLSQLTRKRALRLVRASKGRLCVRYHRGRDGSTLTRSAPQKLYRIGQRASRIAAGAFSATLSLCSASAHAGNIASTMNHSNAAAVSQDPARQLYLGATIVGTVTDPNGAVIPGATIFLSNEQTNLSMATSSNGDGEYRFEGLDVGRYSLRIEAPGFAPVDLTSTYVGANATQRLDKQLEVASIEESVDVTAGERRELVVMGGAMMAVEPSEPLVKAAREDELQDVLALLTRENVNVRDQATGTTALEQAIQNGNREMVQALLSTGADANSRNESKQTALMMMGEEVTADIVWDLIHSGAKVNLKDGDGDTALMEAAMVKNIAVLNALLQAGAKLEERNDAGQTALMWAASNGLMKNVRALIAAGADINARDKEDKTPLSYAKENDHDKVVKLLLSYGAVELVQVEPK
ncbi:MAG: ankyrin repeat domain-containing protein [Pyrinomonadaceae bacterium]|nr:ankyrin repeat domain-containing protein [Pyrinomonadaceae bacterium]